MLTDQELRHVYAMLRPIVIGKCAECESIRTKIRDELERRKAQRRVVRENAMKFAARLAR